MDRDRGFSFKLLVPPRVSHGQVSAVRPQEIVEDCGDFLNPMQQGFAKCFDKEQHILSNKSMVAPTKLNRQDCLKMKVVPPMEKDEDKNGGQLYTKLFDEVEKIKCWKVKMDSDTVQKERKLYENKRTIETQRKAIQELQFGNESLSIKLEEQISENEELRNKNNATRNLCNILKDTFERSAEKMHLFECEREETQHLLMENHQSIQKLIEAFESLCIKAEANQEELHRAKEGLLQIEDLKHKFQQEYNMKGEEVEVLQRKLKDNDNKLEKILLDLQETKELCRVLQEEIGQKCELLKCSNAECDSLLKKLGDTEQCCKDTEAKQEALCALLTERKQEYAAIIKTKDLSLQELREEKNQQIEKLSQMQMTVDQLQESLTVETQKAKELEDKVTANNQELERTKKTIGEMTEQSAKKDKQIKTLTEQLVITSKSIEAINSRMALINSRVEELTAELLNKTEEAQQLQVRADTFLAENESLKKAFENSEKLQEEFRAKSIMAQVQIDELSKQLTAEKKKNEENKSVMEQLQNNITKHERKYEELLSDLNELESVKRALEQKLENRCTDVQTFEANMKGSEEKALKLSKEKDKVEKEKQQLQQELDSIKTTFYQKCQEIETLQKNVEENGENLQEEIREKERRIKVIEAKLCNLRKKLEIKLKGREECQKENKLLQKQMAKEIAKSSELQDIIDSLQEETQNLRRLNEEDRQKLLEDHKNESAIARELQNEVQKLRSTAEEAIRSKEDAELKCQNKITDMVTLMEKHKSQYDRMVQEKDEEHEANKKKEMKAVAYGKSLEQELSKQKTENDSLKKQLNVQITEKEKLQKELTNLKMEVKISQPSGGKNNESPPYNYKEEVESETPKESSLKLSRYNFFKNGKTPSSAKEEWSAAVGKTSTQASNTPSVRSSSCQTTPRTTGIHKEDKKIPRSVSSRSASRIKSYRIRTPPSSEKKPGWGKGTFELDPNSDSSDQGDLLMFASTPAPIFPVSQPRAHVFKKNQSFKSPGNNLKLTAIKRMRDAGWIAVAGSDKKKKTHEKIFA